MEHVIGEIVTLPDGRKVEVVEDKKCMACAYCDLWNVNCLWSECRSSTRSDHKNIVYKEIKEDCYETLSCCI